MESSAGEGIGAGPALLPMTSTAGYAAIAEEAAVRYERNPFEKVHAELLPLLPPAGARVLDVGAGTGRDATALAARGYLVTAAEPVAEMRAVARRLHPDAAVTWVADGLPELITVTGTFDLLLCSAVWMHLDADERRQAMTTIHRLLVPGGLALLTLRHGPVPLGRRMFTVTAAETIALAGEHHLSGELLATDGTDHLGRTTVSWSSVALRAPGNAEGVVLP